jgi:hypothetical protein
MNGKQLALGAALVGLVVAALAGPSNSTGQTQDSPGLTYGGPKDDYPAWLRLAPGNRASAAQAQDWLSFREAGRLIRRWGRDGADEDGATITRQKVSLCERSSRRRVVCWYEEDGFNADGGDYICVGDVRVIKYTTHYNVAPRRRGELRFECF